MLKKKTINNIFIPLVSCEMQATGVELMMKAHTVALSELNKWDAQWPCLDMTGNQVPLQIDNKITIKGYQ